MCQNQHHHQSQYSQLHLQQEQQDKALPKYRHHQNRQNRMLLE
jgi:hypothetical protein